MINVIFFFHLFYIYYIKVCCKCQYFFSNFLIFLLWYISISLFSSLINQLYHKIDQRSTLFWKIFLIFFIKISWQTGAEYDIIKGEEYIFFFFFLFTSCWRSSFTLYTWHVKFACEAQLRERLFGSSSSSFEANICSGARPLFRGQVAQPDLSCDPKFPRYRKFPSNEKSWIFLSRSHAAPMSSIRYITRQVGLEPTFSARYSSRFPCGVISFSTTACALGYRP